MARSVRPWLPVTSGFENKTVKRLFFSRVLRRASAGGGRPLVGHRKMGCLNSVVTTLYGELTPTELFQASFFSLLLCFIVGIYWMMRSLKDSIFATIVGLEYQPM